MMANEQSSKCLDHILNLHSDTIGLEDLWIQCRSVGKELDTVEPLDRIVRCKDPEKVDAAMRQPSLHGGTARNIVELYEAANIAKPIFDQMLQSIIADKYPSITLELADLKPQQTAMEKAENKYGKREPGPSISWLFDIVRAAIICSSEEQIFELVQSLLNNSSLDIVRLKNRFKFPTPAGFRDLLLNIRVRLNESEGANYTCELQIHHIAILRYDKDHDCHSRYKLFREYFQGSTQSVSDRIAFVESMSCYDHDMPWSIIVSDLAGCNDVCRMGVFIELAKLLNELDGAVIVQVQIVSMYQFNGDKDGEVAAISELAELLQRQEKYDEAESRYRQALDLRQKVYGEDHPNVANNLHDLAKICEEQGKNDEAKCFYERSLAIRQKVYEENHPLVAESLDNLATLLQKRDDYDKAERLLRQSLAIRLELYGHNHPSVASSLAKLALCLDDQGIYDEAEPLYKQSLEIWSEVNGDDHLDVILALQNFATFLDDQARYEEAEPLYRRALIARRNIYGEQHPSVLPLLTSLARVLRTQGKYTEAELIDDEHLAISHAVHGSGMVGTIVLPWSKTESAPQA